MILKAIFRPNYSPIFAARQLRFASTEAIATVQKASENVIAAKESKEPTQRPNNSTEKKHKILEVDRLPEAALPMKTAIHLLKSLAIGHPSHKIAVNILCKSGDAASRDLRGACILPHRFLDIKVCVITNDPEQQRIARECGASTVGGEELVAQIKLDKVEMDRLIVTPDIMPLLMPLARQLGPRGIMPTEKKGTVTNDLKQAFQQQADAVLFKCDPNGLISAIIAKSGMETGQVTENVCEFIDKLKATKKGKQKKFVANIWLQSDRESSPLVFIDKSEFDL